MPATKLADILVPSVWVPYMIEKTAERSALFQSGLIQPAEPFNELARTGGSVLNMPFFSDLSGDSEILSDTVALQVNKITSARDIAALHMRGKAWGASDLSQALSGSDPLEAIARLVGNWWARDMQKILVNSLVGAFSAATMSGLTVDISGATAPNNKVNASTTIDAFAVLGDASDKLSAMAMHGAIYHELLKQDLITFRRFSDQGAEIPTYLGKAVVVDDTLPRTTGAGGKTTTFLFGYGAIAYGEGEAPVPAECDRDSLLGEDYLINRRHFLLHPKGVRWIGTAAANTPSNTELATGTNWERVFTLKNIPLVRLISAT